MALLITPGPAVADNTSGMTERVHFMCCGAHLDFNLPLPSLARIVQGLESTHVCVPELLGV